MAVGGDGTGRPASSAWPRIAGWLATVQSASVARGVLPDLLIAALLGAVGVLALLRAQASGTVGQPERAPDALAYLLVALQTVPLCWRRRLPLAVVAVVLPAASAFWLLGYPDARSDLAAPLAFYTVASRLPPAQTVRAAAIVVASVYLLAAAGRAPVDTFLVLHMIYGGAWVLGDTVRRRGERILALQREQQLRIRQAIVEERVRIAQERHDLATHALGVIAIQAQAATRALRQRPEQTEASLAAIFDLADEALTDLRKLLGFLRSDELDARQPQPTLDSLEPLADGFRRAGLPVKINTEGPRRRLTAALQTSAYRVVQEALTNTLKHAGPATAQVALRYGENVLEVEVADTGRGPARTMQPGNGLAGMRERVEVFGGDLSYGASADRGFVVTARMPITEPPDRGDPPAPGPG